MPKTLLAVDDSATMRKVLEITFGGEDFRVLTADGVSAAMARMGDDPVAAVIDTSLGGDDGYALAKELRSRNARLALVVMASRYAPYDVNRGRDAGVDDYIDKPFDTQALIEKVKKAVIARESREVQAPPPAARPAPAPVPVAAAPAPAAASSFATSHAPRPPAPQPTAPVASIPSSKATWPTQRTHTLSFEGGIPNVPPPVRSAPTPAAGAPPPAPPVAAAPSPAPSPPTADPRAPVAVASVPTPVVTIAAVSAAANGHLAGKLGELGLTPQQAEAVLALSREVVERVVWEVVPQLAEAIIKEEIARLTKEG